MPTCMRCSGTLRLIVSVLLCLERSSCLTWPPDLNKVDSPHPMLFFTSRDVPSMQQKARTSHKAIAEQIAAAAGIMKSDRSYLPPADHSAFSSAWNEGYGNNLCALAIYCVLNPNDTEALQLTHEYMDRMEMQRSWEYKSMAKDEMPISHSLVGMATAFDFLYPTLSVDQRERYFVRIRKATSRHFERFKRASWGTYHLQNHVLNNCVALLIGALVTGVHDHRAEVWAELAIGHLNVTLDLLNLIVDGSSDEGVAYSTYTTRSLTMFVSLAKRHYGIDYTENYWLKQHIWFLYGNLLPGYQETVGIADSNPYWFYGLGSMLVFLDKYVLRSGHGNWLAAKTRLQPNLNKSQRWSTYHTEFIWYDETLKDRSFEEENQSKLRCYSDWGVVTYGGGSLSNTTSFLSFKSGMLHGRAINAVVKEGLFPKHVNGWESFNPGHEHPDQNSFTFWPGGRPFITDGYYGPKYSFLNNVLMFQPSMTARCFPPYEGQVGECYKWFDWQSPEASTTSADIVAAYEEGSFVLVSGEAANSYSSQLLLESVYRVLVLLTPDALLVVDHVHLRSGSQLKSASAFFNMRDGKLMLLADENGHHQEAILLRGDKSTCHVAWNVEGNRWTGAALMGYEYPCEFQTRKTQLLNISIELGVPTTRVAYMFMCSVKEVSLPVFLQSADIGVLLQVVVDQKQYDISIVTEHTSPRSRAQWLGHTGFASVYSNNMAPATFGFQRLHHKGSSNYTVPHVFVSSILGGGGDIVVRVLNKSADFVALKYPSKELVWPHEQLVDLKMFADACPWHSQHYPNLLSWFEELYNSPYQMLKKHGSEAQQAFATKPQAEALLYCIDGHMNSKLAIFSALKSNMRIIYVVRDSRSWIASVIRRGMYHQILRIVQDSLVSASCQEGALTYWHKQLRNIMRQKNSVDPILLLSYYWAANVELVQEFEDYFGEKSWLTLHIEDLITSPHSISTDVFDHFLGMPLPLSSRHHLEQLLRSKLYNVMLDEIVEHEYPEIWKEVLNESAVRTIEQITGPLLRLLGYHVKIEE